MCASRRERKRDPTTTRALLHEELCVESSLSLSLFLYFSRPLKTMTVVESSIMQLSSTSARVAAFAAFWSAAFGATEETVAI